MRPTIANLYGVIHYKRAHTFMSYNNLLRLSGDIVRMKQWYSNRETQMFSLEGLREYYTHRLHNVGEVVKVYPADELLVLFLIDDLSCMDRDSILTRDKKRKRIIE